MTDPDPDALLEAAILHWKFIRAEVRVNKPWVSISGTDCPLCAAYPDCGGCPIAEETKQPECCDTPYWRVRGSKQYVLEQLRRHLSGIEHSRIDGMAELEHAVEAEVEFLEQLRDKRRNGR